MHPRKIISVFFIALSLLFFYDTSFAQSVSINNLATPPDPSAMLDVQSIDKGMLVPRMTSAQRLGILAPAIGLLVYDNETNTFWFNAAAGWTELVTGAAGANYWTTNGVHIYNNNTGNVGIGTINPTAKLTIQSDLNTTGYSHIGGTVDPVIVSEAIGGVSAALGVFSNHTLRLVAGPLGKLQVYSNGNVIVGDNNVPSYGKFTVQTPNNSDGISHTSDQGIILSTRVGGTSAGIGTFSNTNMRIFSNGVSAMLIAAATGNVGIGTDNPTYKLSVNGNIRTKEVVVETGWADYVFEEKYKLKTLEEVEKFIGQNKHLAGIPSAGEIEKNGLFVGDTQKKMMEKIEELTLYMIQLNKRIKELEEQNTILKND
jgi:hypothetical protein